MARRTCGAGKHEQGDSANLRCSKVNSHGLATRKGCKSHQRGGVANLRCKKVNSHRLADPARLKEARARWLGELSVQESKLEGTRQGCTRHERGGSANLRCRKTRQGCTRHERGGSANLRCRKVSSHGLAFPTRLQEARATWLAELKVQENPARLQEARARWLGELAMQESKLARVSRPGKVARGTSEVARRTCDAGK
ncbi:hypothetical protein CRG98_040560 [Punica granatum]|uniref:Uncharacterized protein n=1 Tax=Punica granatum TaxID=22663 RepID=A0A2I0I4W1_PUNGR|nr:hypothetical protein CRG98_040560 [Punica granatum]